MKESIQQQVPHRAAAADAAKASAGAVSIADHRPASAAQLKLAALTGSSPGAIAQRKQIEQISGQPAQLAGEEEEPMQAKADALQLAEEEEMPVQGKAVDTLQRVGDDGDDPES
jgi:hypothetical protein